MWHDLAIAIALLLILEGILPFMNPVAWRKAILEVTKINDRWLRVAGFVSMLAGLALLISLK